MEIQDLTGKVIDESGEPVVNGAPEAEVAAEGTQQTPAPAEQQVKEADTEVPKEHLILDAIFTKGWYEEEISLPGGHRCVLKTRSTAESLKITEDIEKDGIQSQRRYDQVFAVYALASSLVSLDGVTLGDNYEERKQILGGTIGAPLADMLIAELGKFDLKVKDAYTIDNVKN